MSRGQISRSTRRTARAGSSARCTSGCCRCPPMSRFGPATSAARCAEAPAWTSRSPRRSASSTLTTRRCSIDEEDEFVEKALAGLGPQPPNFERIVALNRGPLRRESVEAHPLAPRQVEQHREGGALLDRRPHRPSVRRRAHPGRGEQHDAPRRLRQQARLAGRHGPGRGPDRTRRRGRPPRGRARRRGRHHPNRRLPQRRHDGLARGEARCPAHRAAHPCRVPRALGGRPRRRSRCWTSASDPSGTPATSPARSTSPITTSDSFPTGIDPERPLGVVCGSGQRAAVGASLRAALRRQARSSTWSKAAFRCGSAQGWPIEQPDTSSAT